MLHVTNSPFIVKETSRSSLSFNPPDKCMRWRIRRHHLTGIPFLQPRLLKLNH